MLSEPLDEEWRLPDDLVPLREKRLKEMKKRGGPTIYNNANVRLRGLKSQDGRLILMVQPTKYYSHLATNAAMDLPFGPGGKTVRDLLEPGPSLRPFDESLCSNELGMNGLVETGEGSLALITRSAAVVGTAGPKTKDPSSADLKKSLGPSVSGAVGWEAARDGHGICVFQGFRARLNDELGIRGEELTDLRLVGLSRGLMWGGHPALRFLATTKLGEEEIRERLRDRPRDWAEHRRVGRGTPQVLFWPADDRVALEKRLQDPEYSIPVRASLRYYLTARYGAGGRGEASST